MILHPLPDALERHLVPGDNVSFDQNAADRHVGVAIPAVIADPEDQPVLQAHARRALNLDGESRDRIAQPAANLQMPAVERSSSISPRSKSGTSLPSGSRRLTSPLLGKPFAMLRPGATRVIGPTVKRIPDPGRKPRAIDDRLEIPGEQPLRLTPNAQIRSGRKLSSKNARALSASSPGSRRARRHTRSSASRIDGGSCAN